MDASSSYRSRHASRQPSHEDFPMMDRSPRPSHSHSRPHHHHHRHPDPGDDGLPPPNTFSQYKRRRGTDAKDARGSGRRMIQPAGESGRRGFHPWKFLVINFRSASRASLVCNVLWPLVPAALAVRYALPEKHILIFTLAYIAMVPCANLVGFAGQELARKLPHVSGVLAEITFGSVVEIVLFMVLLSKDMFEVIKAAILGSILATMLLCLGLCFFAGGLYYDQQTFSEAISEAGSGLLLTAGVVLAVPTAFERGLAASSLSPGAELLESKTLDISRVISIMLIISYGVYVFFQARTHHGIYASSFEADEARDRDGHKDRAKDKLTLIEAIIALAIGIALVTLIAITLVLQIEHVIEASAVSDAFMGLILVPLVEKFAEHLTAIDEAWDNQMNFALSHVLGATLQTALFNGPLAVIVSWGMGSTLDLNFDLFNLVMLILAILTVGRFLQDQKSNYLEGVLLVVLYIAIAVAAFHYPDPPHEEGGH